MICKHCLITLLNQSMLSELISFEMQILHIPTFIFNAFFRFVSLSLYHWINIAHSLFSQKIDRYFPLFKFKSIHCQNACFFRQITKLIGHDRKRIHIRHTVQKRCKTNTHETEKHTDKPNKQTQPARYTTLLRLIRSEM